MPFLLAVLVAAVGADAYRVGFFADDFHLLDVARRVPLLEALSGQHGIWPWFRPLSREIYFKLVHWSGDYSLVAARTLSLICLWATAWLTWRIAKRLVGPMGAAVAALLVVGYAYTKFLVAWASGFQDLLSVMLILAAIDALAAGARWRAVTSCLLAPFAKETGFVALPLLAIHAYAFDLKDRLRGWLPSLAGATALALALHAIVRTFWVSAGTTAQIDSRPARLIEAVSHALGGAFSAGAPRDGWTLALGLAAGLVALWLLLSRTGERTAPEGAPARRVALFLVFALAVGALPVVVGHLLGLTFAYAYHFYPAVPWAAILVGWGASRLPARILAGALGVLVAVNTWGLAYVAPDLDRSESWKSTPWTWNDAVRLSAVAQRLAADVGAATAERPESLVVLLEGLPLRTFLQTESGPALRVLLDDPTLRSAWVNEPPPGVERGRLAIFVFDDADLHLRKARWDADVSVERAANALIAGRAGAARAFTLYGDAGHEPYRAYVRAGAALLERGPEAFRSQISSEGLPEALDDQPRLVHEAFAAVDDTIRRAVGAVLSEPLSAAAHVQLARCQLDLRRAAVELRIAVTLDPKHYAARFALARSMIALGGGQEALGELALLVNEPAAGEVRQAARELLQGIQD